MAHLWQHKRGERQGANSAADLFANTPVTPSPTGNKGVVGATVSSQEMLGAVWQDTVAGHGAAVYFNSSSVVRMTLAATVATAGAPIGVIGATSAIHPISGATANLPLIGPVAGIAPVPGASGAPATATVVWQVGEAEETGVPGSVISVRINPRQLSGLA